MVEFPKGARIIVGQLDLDDGDPENPVWLSPYVRKVEGGYEVANIDSDGPPIVVEVTAEYESDELEHDFGWVDPDGKRWMCFQPTLTAREMIVDWESG